MIAHPTDAGIGAAGHLEDMRHHVVRARLERIDRERIVRHALGPCMLAVLAEREGAHRQHRGMAGQLARPRRQHRLDAAEQRGLVTREVVERMCHLQRERVARRESQQIVEAPSHALEIIVEPSPKLAHV
jgi:hypothetical protein